MGVLLATGCQYDLAVSQQTEAAGWSNVITKAAAINSSNSFTRKFTRPTTSLHTSHGYLHLLHCNDLWTHLKGSSFIPNDHDGKHSSIDDADESPSINKPLMRSSH